MTIKNKELTKEQLKQVTGGVWDPTLGNEEPEEGEERKEGGCIPPLFDPFS